jgi:hypothetical protein
MQDNDARRVGIPPAPPFFGFNGRYQARTHVTGEIGRMQTGVRYGENFDWRGSVISASDARECRNAH